MTLPEDVSKDTQFDNGLIPRSTAGESPRVIRTRLDQPQQDVSTLNGRLKDLYTFLSNTQINDLEVAKDYMKKVKMIQVTNTENMDTLASIRKLIARDLEAIKRKLKKDKQANP